MTNNIDYFLKQFYITDKEIVKEINYFFKTFDITFLNYLILYCLKNNKPVYIQEICNELSLDTGTITPASKRLEKKGVIIRKRSILDERRVTIQLTEEGKQLQKEISNSMNDLIDKLNTNIPGLSDYLTTLNRITV
ncbi:MarR family transcriptional regulator [Staphylococcus caeli]|uniref:HTH-type transcriptional regulator SarZ n=1 Tax=Staphylococcus caeli TaxID=2201815 RepID=A0A1D4MSK7_9STAP|nr:MarR family transcriptional regulator [Staphylococcus caeli]SCS82802.1 transcriptional regulator [Staphylococcus caeli]SCT01319.1 transcriptional regulator [Staphylococcus caeli]